MLVVAVASFLVAGMLLGGDDSEADPAAAPIPDAAVVVDAGPPDAAVKKVKPKPKKRTRKKPAPRKNN